MNSERSLKPGNQTFTAPNATNGKLVSHQAICLRTDKTGLQHQLDIHWRISNDGWFSGLLTYDGLKQNTMAVSVLSSHAITLDPVGTLFLACLHRASHAVYGESNRLVWLYDIHLLCQTLTPDNFCRFTEQAKQHAMTKVCLDALEQSRSRFRTKIDESIFEVLQQGSSQPEPSARYLQASHLTHFKCNLDALPTLGDKLTYIIENLFPPQSYMLSKYKTRNRLLLPLLYLHRFILGCKKQICRKKKEDSH